MPGAFPFVFQNPLFVAPGKNSSSRVLSRLDSFKSWLSPRVVVTEILFGGALLCRGQVSLSLAMFQNLTSI